MNQNPITTAATAVGVAGGAAVLAPVAVPTLHGIAGIAVVGLGVYATGTAIFNAARFLNEKTSGLLSGRATAIELPKGSVISKSTPKVPAREIPFKR
jgi:hypothetical protein